MYSTPKFFKITATRFLHFKLTKVIIIREFLPWFKRVTLRIVFDKGGRGKLKGKKLHYVPYILITKIKNLDILYERSTTLIPFDYVKFVIMAVTPTCRKDRLRLCLQGRWRTFFSKEDSVCYYYINYNIY